MKSPKIRGVLFFLVGLFVVCSSVYAIELDASSPKSVTLSVYDTGIGLFSELRLITLAPGENRIRFGDLPVHLDPATVAVMAPGGRHAMKLLGYQFRYDLRNDSELLKRYLGKEVAIRAEDMEAGGVLLSAPGIDGDEEGKIPLAVTDSEGGVDIFPDMDEVSEIVFPGAGKNACLRPTLFWRVESKEDAQRNVRLQYSARGISWNVFYEAILNSSGNEAYFVGRVEIQNGTGGSYRNARVRLIETEKGDAGVGIPRAKDSTLRYAYGHDEPTFERTVASASALRAYDVPGPVSLERGETVYVLLTMAERVPVERFYVYDGVEFDRFQRNPRNDWNYGVKSQPVIEAYARFSNSKSAGLGVNLPRGQFRLYRENEDGSVDLVGDVMMSSLEAGKETSLLLGPARGLIGKRERTDYTELRPLHEYEESFEIRLENTLSEEVTVRVVEHLYRWHTFEIVKADADYTQTGNQTIEFHPILKPGGQKSIHYTVRYNW